MVADRGRFDEAEARLLFTQALDGLLFMKQHGVCHRCVSGATVRCAMFCS